MPYSYVFLSLTVYMIVDHYIFEILSTAFYFKVMFRKFLHCCCPMCFKEYNIYWLHDDLERDDEYLIERKKTLQDFIDSIKFPMPGLKARSSVQALYFYAQIAYLFFNFVYIWVYTENTKGSWERYQVAYGRFVNGLAGNIISNFLGLILMMDQPDWGHKFMKQLKENFADVLKVSLSSRSHGYNRMCPLSTLEHIRANFGSEYSFVAFDAQTPMADQEGGSQAVVHCSRCLRPIELIHGYFKGENCSCTFCTACVPNELGPSRRRTKLIWAAVFLYPAFMTHSLPGFFAYIWVIFLFGIAAFICTFILMWIVRIVIAIPKLVCVVSLPFGASMKATRAYDKYCFGAEAMTRIDISFAAMRLFASFFGFLIIQQSYNYAYLLYKGDGYLNAIVTEATLRTSQCYYVHMFNDLLSYLQFFNWV